MGFFFLLLRLFPPEKDEQQLQKQAEKRQNSLRVPAVDRDQVALHLRVVRRELRHRLERRPFNHGQPGVAVGDAVRLSGGGTEPGLCSGSIGVLPEVEHDNLRLGVGLSFFSVF